MNLRAAVVGVALALAGCGGPEYPPPAAGKAQVVVKLAARPKAGIHGPRGDSGDAYSSSGRDPETGRRYARVNYDELADIAVLLNGAGLGDDGPAPRSARLTIGAEGADHRLVLLGPKKHTQLTLANGTKKTLTLGCLGASNDGFCVTVAAGSEQAVTLSDPGTYELTCDEDSSISVTLVVAPTTWATTGVSDSEVFFDNLPPGTFDVLIEAPRLPEVVRHVSTTAGARATVEAECSVNSMEFAK